ncbi:hypothetical protein KAR91_38210, partial [Candidatus Pacearchaeota archaeon]|nr:hypothetical protein [Candidatus Pacearchaeota archaeon]
MGFVNFDSISLVNFEQSSDIGTGKAVSSNTPLQGGGSIDDYGAEATFAATKPRINKGIVLKATSGDLELYLNQLKVRRGTRGKLTKLDANEEPIYQYARLVEVKEIRTTKEARHTLNKIQSISLAFICDSDTWFGDEIASWKLNDGELINDNLVLNGGDPVDLSASPETHTVTITQDSIESKITTRNPIFTFIVPAGESFTSMLIENDQGGSLLFTGTVAAETQLVINCAALRVLNNAV